MLECYRSYRFAQRLGSPEEPGRPLDFSLGCTEARQPIQALRGDHLVAQLIRHHEAFFVGGLGPLVIAPEQRRPSQVVHGVVEADFVSALS